MYWNFLDCNKNICVSAFCLIHRPCQLLNCFFWQAISSRSRIAAYSSSSCFNFFLFSSSSLKSFSYAKIWNGIRKNSFFSNSSLTVYRFIFNSCCRPASWWNARFEAGRQFLLRYILYEKFHSQPESLTPYSRLKVYGIRHRMVYYPCILPFFYYTGLVELPARFFADFLNILLDSARIFSYKNPQKMPIEISVWILNTHSTENFRF